MGHIILRSDGYYLGLIHPENGLHKENIVFKRYAVNAHIFPSELKAAEALSAAKIVAPEWFEHYTFKILEHLL